MKTGTIIYFADMGSDWKDKDVEQVVEKYGIEPKLVAVATEHDLYDHIRILIQRGASYIEAICIRKESDGTLNSVGEGTRIYG